MTQQLRHSKGCLFNSKKYNGGRIMNDQCKECIHVTSLKNEISDVKNRVDKVETKVEKMDTAISIIDKEVGINQEQTKMVFKILTEIKASIEKISNKMDVVEKRPSNTDINNNVKQAKQSSDGNGEILSSMVKGNNRLLYGVIAVLAIITLFSIGMKASDIARLMGK